MLADTNHIGSSYFSTWYRLLYISIIYHKVLILVFVHIIIIYYIRLLKNKVSNHQVVKNRPARGNGAFTIVFASVTVAQQYYFSALECVAARQPGAGDSWPSFPTGRQEIRQEKARCRQRPLALHQV